VHHNHASSVGDDVLTVHGEIYFESFLDFTVQFDVWAPHFGWTPHLNYSLLASSRRSLIVRASLCVCAMCNVSCPTILLANVRYMLSPVRLLSVCLLSVTLVHPTGAVVIFDNFSTAFGTLAIMTCAENFMEIVPGEPLRRGS